jgi:hypothetical protein
MAYPLDNFFGRRGRVTTDVARLRTEGTRDSRVLAVTVRNYYFGESSHAATISRQRERSGLKRCGARTDSPK